jgi:proline dehydrogenase
MDLFNNTRIAYARMNNYELRRAYLLFKSLQVGFIFKAIKQLVRFCFQFRLPVGWIVKPTVFKQFIGGTSLNECVPVATQLAKYQVKAILDYSAEDGSTEEMVEQTLAETLQSIEVASQHANIVFAVFKPTAFCAKEVLEVMSSGAEISEDIMNKARKFRSYVDILCKKAFELDVPIMIDAEDYAFQAFVDEVVNEMMAKYNRQKAVVYNTFQMYRRDRLEFLDRTLRDAEKKNYYPGVKLVRGAYMERERIRAEKMGYSSPIWENKKFTDEAFNKALEFCVRNIHRISLFSGTHNEHSNMCLMQLIADAGLENNDSRIYFSQLYGMSDNITFNLAQLHYNVAKYIPYGPVRKVLPYLIRRAEENSSVAGQTCRELSLISRELNRRANENS